MGKKKLYAVRAPTNSRGVYKTWDECKSKVSGVKGAVFKGFETQAQVDAFMGGSNESYGAKAKEKQPSKVEGRPKAAASVFSGRKITRDAVLIYTDGSCLGNNNVKVKKCPAGWGAVVLTNCEGTESYPADTDGSAEVLARLYGPVLLDPMHPQYMGAEVGSNNTGELTAIGEALRWVDASNIANGALVVIRYDSKYAANISNGTWTAHANQLLAKVVQALHTKCSKKRRIVYSHVKGHSNHMWNDEADRLANMGGRGESSSVTSSVTGGSADENAEIKCERKREAPEMVPLGRKNKKQRPACPIGGPRKNMGGQLAGPSAHSSVLTYGSSANGNSANGSSPAVDVSMGSPTLAARAPPVDQWSCAVCTLLNPALYLACSACGSQRTPEGDEVA
jgi:ribonuclease HI